MKNLFKKTLILAAVLLCFNCDNDDGNAPNMMGCTFQGLTAEDSSGTNFALIAEAQLSTDYFPNNNGPNMPAVEVFETTNPGNTFIVTEALTVGAVDSTPQIVIGGTTYTGTVTCQLAGSAVGDELRFDIVLSNGSEAELCVIIDNVTP